MTYVQFELRLTARPQLYRPVRILFDFEIALHLTMARLPQLSCESTSIRMYSGMTSIPIPG